MLPRHLPFTDGPQRLRVGTRTLAEGDWLEGGADVAAQLREKARLLRESREAVLQELPGSEGACAELLRVVEGAVGAEAPAASSPLEAAALLVAEDLCVHLPGPDGRLRLAAACVCFPSRWVLAEKMGQPVAGIHDPVPGYADAIGRPVDQLMERLPHDRLLWRLGGSILDDPALFQPRRATLSPARVPDDVWLRVERQTLRRLPESGAVVFTIRTFVDPLSCLTSSPAACADAAAWVRGLTPEMTAYKSLEGMREPLLAWLDEQALTASGPPAAG
ncbi:uncharacterized protein DUF3445 [Motilibacter rhizosphaerae]|uniref:Uncharacterized protein DUF3445 n=1 Tax=Motilibacter rhizosphaerae TaxID=598652 RepID=A0A4Q7NUG6_9ACTN|nr:DUF3445 domain-containing protein [Motilibacter rhizosphaerae]RZS90831.1 uncharacterized protein DUF3445 [Motilibacter rhizosphaerae]